MGGSENGNDLQTGKQDAGQIADDIPPELQNLPPEMRTMVSVMAGFFRSNSGPDAETAKIMAEAEMHEETCKYKRTRSQCRIEIKSTSEIMLSA